jgi:hypothetical protein
MLERYATVFEAPDRGELDLFDTPNGWTMT